MFPDPPRRLTFHPHRSVDATRRIGVAVDRPTAANQRVELIAENGHVHDAPDPINVSPDGRGESRRESRDGTDPNDRNRGRIASGERRTLRTGVVAAGTTH